MHRRATSLHDRHNLQFHKGNNSSFIVSDNTVLSFIKINLLMKGLEPLGETAFVTVFWISLYMKLKSKTLCWKNI